MKPTRPAAYLIRGPHGNRVTLSSAVASGAIGLGASVEPLYRASLQWSHVVPTESEVELGEHAATQDAAGDLGFES